MLLLEQVCRLSEAPIRTDDEHLRQKDVLRRERATLAGTLLKQLAETLEALPVHATTSSWADALEILDNQIGLLRTEDRQPPDDGAPQSTAVAG